MEGDNREEIVEDSDVDAETEEQPVVEAVGNPQPILNPLVEDPQIIMPIKVPSIPSEMRYDRRKPGTSTSWSGFRMRLNQFILYNRRGQEAEWNHTDSKRVLFLCLGETELLMCKHLFTPENIEALDAPGANPPVISEYGTITKMLDKCEQIFMPMSETRLSKEAFERCYQSHDETVDTFLSRLKLLFSAANPDHELERQDILVDKFVRGLLNDRARYAINSAENPVGDNIVRAVKIANSSISAQIAETPLNKRDAAAQGLATANLTSKTSLGLIKELQTDSNSKHGLNAYQKVVGGTSTPTDLNNTLGGGAHTYDQVEPMELGAMSNWEFGYDEEELTADLLDGMYEEQMSFVAAFTSGKRELGKMKCFYCDNESHLIADCYKRKSDIRNGSYAPRNRGRRGTGRGSFGNRGNRGNANRGGYNANRGGYNNRGGNRGGKGTSFAGAKGGYSAGIYNQDDEEVLSADEGNVGRDKKEDENSGKTLAGTLGALQLGDEELDLDMRENYDCSESMGALNPYF